MLPFNNGNGEAYRRDLLERAEESITAAQRLMNIYAALAIATFSLHRDEKLPAEIEEILMKDEVEPQARLVAQDCLQTLSEPEGQGYGLKDFFLPTEDRMRLFYIPSTLFIKEGVSGSGDIPAHYSPTGADMNVFDRDFAAYNNHFIEYQIDLADKIVEALVPLIDTMWDFVEGRLDLGYEGLDLWPFAMAVMHAKQEGEDLSEPLEGWIHEHWDVAIEAFNEYESRFDVPDEDDIDDEDDIEQQPAPRPTLH
ncbi:MAG TPA: hypothetical protein PLO23_03225 [Alphaproteobacteria bacterium]|nr:hypothetical protein [Alphaproteobacteria bacterium]